MTAQSHHNTRDTVVQDQVQTIDVEMPPTTQETNQRINPNFQEKNAHLPHEC